MLLWKMNSFAGYFQEEPGREDPWVDRWNALHLGFECKTCLKNVKNLDSIIALFKSFEISIGNTFSSKIINK